MINTNSADFCRNAGDLFRLAVNDGEIVKISGDNGGAVLISESDYNSLIETLYLSTPEMKNIILNGLNTPLDECIPEDEVNW